MKDRGILIVVSGFSGAGKGTITREIIGRSDNYALSISATTRAPRDGEQEGVHYFYKTKEEFERMIADNELLEYAVYQGNYYGTPKAYVLQQLAEGRDVILEIEVQGGDKIKAQVPDCVRIFVTPPTAEELRKRLMGRGTETPAQVLGRMKRAVEEAPYMPLYDHILINDQLDKAIEAFERIVQSEHMKQTFIGEITDELIEIVKGE